MENLISSVDRAMAQNRIIDRIKANPNPRSFRGRWHMLLSVVWGVRSLDRKRLIETWRTTFAIMGSCGYAGYLSSMHVTMAIVSLVLTGGTAAIVYTMIEL